MTDTPARVTYHFPDDVVVTTDSDGKKTARLAFVWNTDEKQFLFRSDEPVVFSASEQRAVVLAYETAWLAARERQRDAERDAFLNTYPAVARDRASWAAFISEGNQPSISAWRLWGAAHNCVPHFSTPAPPAKEPGL